MPIILPMALAGAPMVGYIILTVVRTGPYSVNQELHLKSADVLTEACGVIILPAMCGSLLLMGPPIPGELIGMIMVMLLCVIV